MKICQNDQKIHKMYNKTWVVFYWQEYGAQNKADFGNVKKANALVTEVNGSYFIQPTVKKSGLVDNI